MVSRNTEKGRLTRGLLALVVSVPMVGAFAVAGGIGHGPTLAQAQVFDNSSCTVSGSSASLNNGAGTTTTASNSFGFGSGSTTTQSSRLTNTFSGGTSHTFSLGGAFVFVRGVGNVDANGFLNLLNVNLAQLVALKVQTNGTGLFLGDNVVLNGALKAALQTALTTNGAGAITANIQLAQGVTITGGTVVLGVGNAGATVTNATVVFNLVDGGTLTSTELARAGPCTGPHGYRPGLPSWHNSCPKMNVG